MPRHVIGFAGRLQSGKTELAKICEEFGYKRLSVALPLKEMVAALLNETIEGVNMLKTANNHYVFDEEDREYIAYRTRIPISIIDSKLTDRVFKNTREIMQFIGTDLIREFNPNWHVDELRKMMEDDGNYVVDDVRFPNERKLIEDLGGTCWFIVRPKLDNVLNHESETSLKWQDFKHILINDKDLDSFQNGWRDALNNFGYEEFLRCRENVLDGMICLGGGNTTIDSWVDTLNKHLISHWQFLYSSQDLTKFTYEYGNVYQTFSIGARVVINPLLIEDFKFTL